MNFSMRWGLVFHNILLCLFYFICIFLTLWLASAHLLTSLQFVHHSLCFISGHLTSRSPRRLFLFTVFVLVHCWGMTTKSPFHVYVLSFIYWRLFSLLLTRPKPGVSEQDGAFDHSGQVFLTNSTTYTNTRTVLSPGWNHPVNRGLWLTSGSTVVH